MTISPLISLPSAQLPVQSVLGSGSFQKIMKSMASEKASKEKEADQAATGLVANALILPILKQVRRSMSNMEGPFSPGNGEKTFGPEFDMQLADRIAQSPNLGVKKALVQRLIKRGQPAVVPGVHKGLNVHG